MANNTYTLGRVGLNLRGEYNQAAAYEPLDVVSWHGSSYAAKAATTGAAPSDTDKWEMLVQGPAAHSTGEQATGARWIDGKEIYARTIRYSAPATAKASIEHSFDFSGMDSVWVDASSTFLVLNDGTSIPQGYVASNTDRQFMVQPRPQSNTILMVTDGAGLAHIRLLYTKTSESPAYYHLPFLTANSDKDCVASASSEYNTGNQRAWNGFSGDPQTEWCSTTADTNRWLQIRMPYTLRNIVVTLVDRKDVEATPARALTAGSFQGSNNGTSWTTLATFSGRNPNRENYYTTRHELGNATAYKYLRFVPDRNSYTTALGTGVSDMRVEGEIAGTW